MRRGIIGKLKESLSKKPKLPDLIRANIIAENLKDFKVDVKEYQKEVNDFKINRELLDFDFLILELERETELKIEDSKFIISDVETPDVDVEEINCEINSESELVFNPIIKEVKVDNPSLDIYSLKGDANNVQIEDGMDLICNIGKTYYSEIGLSKTKIREIGIKIKKKYPEISFKEFGIKHVFIDIPYKSIEKFNYMGQKGSLEVFYKKQFEKSELINFVVLENINTKSLKKIFI